MKYRLRDKGRGYVQLRSEVSWFDNWMNLSLASPLEMSPSLAMSIVTSFMEGNVGNISEFKTA